MGSKFFLFVLSTLLLEAGSLPNAAFAGNSGQYVFVPSPHGLGAGQNATFLGMSQRVLPQSDGQNPAAGGTLRTAFGVINDENCFFEAGLSYDDSYPTGRERTVRANVKFGAKGDGAWRPTFYAGTLFNSTRATYADQNLIYLATGWVLENWGTMSFGGYIGNGGRLKDESGLQANRGFIFGFEKDFIKLGDSNSTTEGSAAKPVRIAITDEGITGQNEVAMITTGLKYKKGDQYFFQMSYSWTHVKAFGSDFVHAGVGFSL